MYYKRKKQHQYEEFDYIMNELYPDSHGLVT
jgi:hypothetical protein